MRQASASRAHMPQLDGLRAVAVTVVVASHTVPDAWLHGFPAGGAAVRLFFVLSGFLITGILLDARDAPSRGGALTAFALRRFLRIFPLYYLVLAVAVALALPDVRNTIEWTATYTFNLFLFAEGRWRDPAHLWSLAVEEQFYVFWPFLILFAPARLLRPLILACVAAGPLSRLGIYAATGNELTRFLTPCCLDSLGAGALLAWNRRFLPPAGGVGRSGFGLAAGLVAVVAAFSLPPKSLGFVTVADAALSLLFYFVVDGAARGFRGLLGVALASPPAAYVGKISYGLYVMHDFVPHVVRRAEAALHVSFGYPDPGLARFAVVSILTLTAAAVSWHLFEAPLLRLKRYVPYEGRREAFAAGAPRAGRPAF